MIKRYQKKPVVIMAVQWTGDNAEEVMNFCNPPDIKRTDEYNAVLSIDEKTVKIFTLEGTMEASIGDFIIRGVHNEFYPCKPDIFEETYMEWIGVSTHE